MFKRKPKSKPSPVQAVYDAVRNTPAQYTPCGKVSGVSANALRDAYRLAGTRLGGFR